MLLAAPAVFDCGAPGGRERRQAHRGESPPNRVQPTTVMAQPGAAMHEPAACRASGLHVLARDSSGMLRIQRGTDMPPRGVKSAKRARQYEHIKESAQKRGRSTKRAKEIAARTVNKQRAQAGETKSRSSSRS